MRAQSWDLSGVLRDLEKFGKFLWKIQGKSSKLKFPLQNPRILEETFGWKSKFWNGNHQTKTNFSTFHCTLLHSSNFSPATNLDNAFPCQQRSQDTAAHHSRSLYKAQPRGLDNQFPVVLHSDEKGKKKQLNRFALSWNFNKAKQEKKETIFGCSFEAFTHSSAGAIKINPNFLILSLTPTHSHPKAQPRNGLLIFAAWIIHLLRLRKWFAVAFECSPWGGHVTSHSDTPQRVANNSSSLLAPIHLPAGFFAWLLYLLCSTHNNINAYKKFTSGRRANQQRAKKSAKCA